MTGASFIVIALGVLMVNGVLISLPSGTHGGIALAVIAGGSLVTVIGVVLVAIAERLGIK